MLYISRESPILIHDVLENEVWRRPCDGRHAATEGAVRHTEAQRLCQGLELPLRRLVREHVRVDVASHTAATEIWFSFIDNHIRVHS